MRGSLCASHGRPTTLFRSPNQAEKQRKKEEDTLKKTGFGGKKALTKASSLMEVSPPSLTLGIHPWADCVAGRGSGYTRPWGSPFTYQGQTKRWPVTFPCTRAA